MKKLLLSVVVVILTITTGYGQSLWTKTSEARLSAIDKTDRASVPREYELYSLDLAAMKNLLSKAPSRENTTMPGLNISFPNPAGQMMQYKIYESSVMEPELAARHQNIQSYVGKGISDPTASISVTTTIFGLHAMILSANGTYYIDTYTKDLQNYIVYNKSSLVSKRMFNCETESAATPAMPSETSTTMANDGRFRSYRLAMACTIEYAAYHISAAGQNSGTLAQKKAAVLAAMNVTVARVNSVFERDLSLRVVLVATNENVIFVTSDNFDNLDTSGNLIDQSQSVITSTIGVGNFDIGHTVSTGDGGVAALGGVCFSNAKAAAYTGNPAPVGDPFDIDYVAHEMGHQFGAEHTFNSTSGGGCVAQTRSANQAVEPGSGSTIMAYAGICMDNVQNNSDAYFHTVSISQIQANLTTQSTCVAGTLNNNTPPSIPVLPNYTIPKGTPFYLTGSATDANGDTMTYTWEQTNANGSTAMPGPNTTSGPSFRSYPPSTSPRRYFPSLANLAGTGSPYEVLPNVVRTMNFAFTARDNRTPNGGQTSRRDITVTTSASGPFAVTSQNQDNLTWTTGQTQTITWDVVSTNAAPFNVANVKISLSTDGGLTYPVVLAESTPNDGSHDITVPSVAAPFCRIMVEAVGHIFFAINAKPFGVNYTVTNTCTTFTNNTALPVADGMGTNQPALGPIAQASLNVPSTGTISDLNFSINATHSYVQDLIAALVHPDGTQIDLFQFLCGPNNGLNAKFSDGAAAPSCPAGEAVITGVIAPFEPLSGLNGKASNGTYTFIIADTFQGDTGTVNSWSLEFCTQTITPLSTENMGLKDFAVYPNPNKGIFNIDFTSLNTSDIVVGVHDLSGRLIFEKTFTNNGRFAESIHLNNVQTGMYVVTVQNGNSKEVKKIIIE